MHLENTDKRYMLNPTKKKFEITEVFQMEVRKDGLYMNIKTALILTILERNVSIKKKFKHRSVNHLSDFNFERIFFLANDVKYAKFTCEYGLCYEVNC